MSFPVERIRSRFPSLALRHGGRRRVYFDNPAGTQIAKPSLQRMNDYMLRSVANSGAVFRTSLDTDALVAEARNALAQFFNARSGHEIVFGASMTTLTLHMIQALGPRFSPGDEIIVTRMDHDGNVSPWRLLAQRCGLNLKILDFNDKTFRYELAELDRLLTSRTRLIAVNHASNLTGTINDVEAITARAKAAGALVYVDAVQSAPHCPIDVQALGCDFLVCSAYKFFGPHLGVLWGRKELLESLTPPKLRAATNDVPNRYETGTLPFELIAGVLGAVEYYAWVGDLVDGRMSHVASRGKGPKSKSAQRARPPVARRGRLAQRGSPTLAERITRGKVAMQKQESLLALELIRGLRELPGARIYGITSESELADRVSTVSFTFARMPSRHIATELAKREIYVWDGDFYAIDIGEKFGLASSGGAVRAGPVHYNTIDEVRRFLGALRDIVRSRRSRHKPGFGSR